MDQYQYEPNGANYALNFTAGYLPAPIRTGNLISTPRKVKCVPVRCGEPRAGTAREGGSERDAEQVSAWGAGTREVTSVIVIVIIFNKFGEL